MALTFAQFRLVFPSIRLKGIHPFHILFNLFSQFFLFTLYQASLQRVSGTTLAKHYSLYGLYHEACITLYWVSHRLKHIELDLVILHSQFQLSPLHIYHCPASGEKWSTQYYGYFFIFFHVYNNEIFREYKLFCLYENVFYHSLGIF